MSNLLENLQALGDAEHDDLSVAHDALAEIVKLRLEKADLLEALMAFDAAAKDSKSIIGFAGKALPLVQKARAAIIRAKGEQ